MAKRTTYGTAQLVEPTHKKTSIGGGKTKMASMNKHKKRSHKFYRGQGR